MFVINEIDGWGSRDYVILFLLTMHKYTGAPIDAFHMVYMFVTIEIDGYGSHEIHWNPSSDVF